MMALMWKNLQYQSKDNHYAPSRNKHIKSHSDMKENHELLDIRYKLHHDVRLTQNNHIGI